MEEKNKSSESVKEYAEENTVKSTVDTEVPLDKNIRLMSPTRMVVRRFFRSRLSVIGLVLIIALFLFSWVGPLFWNVSETDRTMKIDYDRHPIEYVDENGETRFFYQIVETGKELSSLAPPSAAHPLGTDMSGRDNLTRLMTGGRVSLSISFLAVFIIMLLGVIFGGLAGYFGGVIDNIIMRACDILMCLPGIPVMLIVNTVLEGLKVDSEFRIYYLMGFLTLISWSGTARLVRGQILSLREQEYMVAAEAMGYSTGRKIFKHLVPNVMPQLIVSTTMSLGSMILYEATLSYLGLGASDEFAAWGTMINAATDSNILQNYFNIWGPPGICIVLAVLGFNFVGDGLRDALDPKMRR
jgi:peptide/nickel transport system permease protein